MTILYTQPDGAQSPRPAYPAPTPATEIFGATDPGEVVHAVVTVQVAMTRDTLAAALDLATANAEEWPDDWSVPYIRESVELQLTYENALRLEQDGARYATREFLDESVLPYIEAIYRAVDRAYSAGR
ncbi:hypothetical protein [Streptomyces virginiae]|uniref:hypothetical protein n=1 Tax=Streptomyces virginiae TaxID=1961 RepID=UPI00379313CD